MKTSTTTIRIGVTLLLSATLIGNTFALDGPNGENPKGLFATYFETLTTTSCPGGIITGFSSDATTYLQGTCTSIGYFLGTILSGDAPAGQAVIGFGSDGTPKYGAVGSGGGGGTFSGWSLTGNLNTNPALNYIGTTDAQDLVFKTNDIERIRITSGGNVTGLGNGLMVSTSSFAFGSSAGANMNGAQNTALGGSTAGNNMNGAQNTAVGGLNVGANMNGAQNTALGGSTTGNNASGTQNTAVGGLNVGANMNGAQNTAVGGYQAGTSMSGSQNTAIGGYYAGNSMVGVGNTAIGGYNATILNNAVQYSVVIGSGARSNRSGAVVIGGSGSNVGIGTPNPIYKLDVTGDLHTTGRVLSDSGIFYSPTQQIVDRAGWTYFQDNLGAYSNGLTANRIYGVTSVSSPTLCIGTNCITSWGSAGAWATVAGGVAYTGGNIGIGTSVLTYALNVAGTGSMSGLRLPTGASNGYILVSDSSGNARWESTGSLIGGGGGGGPETDPIWTTQKSLYATLASPALTGTPTAPTPINTDNSTTLATTAFVKNQGYIKTYTETDPTISAWAKSSTKPSYNFTEITGTITETDPQVGAVPENFIPKMYGGVLTGSVIRESSISNTIGINTAATSAVMLSMKYDINNGYGILIQNSNANGYSNVVFTDQSGTAGANIGHDNAGNSFYLKSKNGEPIIFLTNNAEQMRLSPTGNLGIGMASGGEKLEVAGNVKAVGFLYSSDKRLKSNIAPLQNVDEKLSELNGVQFVWKESGRSDIGFIAQDIEKVFPEIVHTSTDGMKSVEYANITALLVEGYKYQKKEAEIQKARADSLEKRIEALEKRID